MKKRVLFILMLSVLLIFVSCASQENGENDLGDIEGSGDVENIEENLEQEANDIPEGKTMIKLYYVNQDYVITGDESMDKIIPIEKEIQSDGRNLEEIIIEELQKSPEADELSTIPERLKILKVEAQENTAIVDFSSEGLYGGSLEEQLLLQQIVFSLTELPDIEQVQILVDGKKQESLMGHIEIMEPIKRNDVDF